MASSSTLSYLPREVRFKVYEAVAARPSGTKTVLQRWFEKRDIEEQIAQFQNTDPETIYRAAYDREDSSPDEHDEHHLQEEVDEEDDDEMQIDEDVDDENDDDGDDEDQDDEFDSEEDDDLDDSEENEDENEEEHGIENEEGDDDDDEITESEDPDEIMISNEMGTTTADITISTGDGADATSAPQTPARPVRHIRAHRKWRHIPKFLRISHCPPPQELMLLSKDLAEEVREWFYKVAVVHINATGSFAHTSMLDEVFLQTQRFAFSPFESIRKVEASFVYDSQWVRGPDCCGNGEFFEQILLMRADKIVEFLKSQVPQLKEVEINWHDTVSDNRSAALKYDVLEIFDGLPVDIETKEHYLTPGKKPHRKSLLGKKRLEFQDIADHGFRLI